MGQGQATPAGVDGVLVITKPGHVAAGLGQKVDGRRELAGPDGEQVRRLGKKAANFGDR